jgi:hypothetical protein
MFFGEKFVFQDGFLGRPIRFVTAPEQLVEQVFSDLGALVWVNCFLAS